MVLVKVQHQFLAVRVLMDIVGRISRGIRRAMGRLLGLVVVLMGKVSRLRGPSSSGIQFWKPPQLAERD